jgi:basic membrane protein A
LLKVIDEQYNAGYNVFILPGGLFWGSVVYEAQGKYEDAKFVLIDGLPNPGDPEEVSINTNTVAVTFDVSKSGFLAGFSTALELKNAEIGFIGGAPIPDVQMYNWGFQQGVIYANENYGTQCSMKAENWVYQGTFHETEAGRALAADMFDRGVKAIFCVAGPVGRAAIEEAKDRAMQEQKVYAIGADFDQYQMGIYAEDDSVLLTSATKGYGKAAHDAIVDLCEGNFRGGQEIVISGGIPQVNPNLSKDTFDIVEDVSEKIKSGNIQVLNVQGDLLP